MNTYKTDLLPKHEIYVENLALGSTDNMMILYARHYLKDKNNYKAPTLNELNYFGRRLGVKFMLRHELPKTLTDNGVYHTYFTPSQLPKGVYFQDDTLNGRIYIADTTVNMPNRYLRRHYVAYPKSLADVVQPEQRVIKAIIVNDQKALKDYKKWHKELLEAEEAIKILEPGYEAAKRSKELIFTKDLCNMLHAAYLEGMHPAAVLADISDRNYDIPEPNIVGVGTELTYHTWMYPA